MKLKFLSRLLLISSLGLFLASCQKEVDFQNEGGPGPGPGQGTNFTPDITGSWKFVGLSADTRVDITVTESGQNLKAVTTSSYSSDNNTGTLTVTSNQFIYSGISATVEGEQNVKTYLNGILFDDQTMPYNSAIPSTDLTSDYVRNSNDSLTFTNALLTIPDPNGGTTAPAPTGARISLTGDTLTVVTKSIASTTITQNGVPGLFDARIDGIMKFTRQ
jgi:hypothetical protein